MSQHFDAIIKQMLDRDAPDFDAESVILTAQAEGLGYNALNNSA